MSSMITKNQYDIVWRQKELFENANITLQQRACQSFREIVQRNADDFVKTNLSKILTTAVSN